MSSTPSYPLIGIDHNRNEYPKEWQGRNAEDAAERLAQHYGYIKVLSGFQGQKRGSNGSGIYNRKTLFERQGGAYKIPSANAALADVLGRHAEALGRRLVEETKPVIDSLRERGLSFTLLQVDGKTKLKMVPLVTCTVSERERGKIKDLVRENMATFIEALEAEAAAANGPQEKSQEPVDPLKGKTIQDIILSMLPQMPTPFTCDDLIARLQAAGFAEFAEDRPRVTSNIHYAITKGQVEQAGRAKYRVKEEFRHRRAAATEPPKQPDSPKEAAPVVETAQPPALPDPQPDLPLEMLQVPREVIVVPAPPEPEPEPQPALVPAVVNAHQVLVATLLDLASQAATGDDDIVSLAKNVSDGVEQFQNIVLDGLTALTNTVQPFMELLNKRAAAKREFLRSLSLPDQNLR